ncbi:hypothetical protein [Streptomyces sp. NPDC089799]|uniref:hypothetical protein n=1 Tax=Streptomyces sp. NPDC089799 TaxID=3155066 RepID=UPI003442A035
MAGRGAWDQRVVAADVLTGTATDRGLLEEGVAAAGWEVLVREGPAEASATTEGVWQYLVEVRFPGSAYRASTGGRERLETLADELGVDLLVEVVEPVDRDPADPLVWYAYERPDLGTCTTPLPLRERVRERLADAAGRRLGAYDTGRQIRAADEVTARRLAGRDLPGARTALPGRLSVRLPEGRRHAPRAVQRDRPVPRRRQYGRRSGLLRYPVLLAMACGAFTGLLWDRGMGTWWFVIPLLLLAAMASFWIIRSAVPAKSVPQTAVAAFLLIGTIAALSAHSVRAAPDIVTGFLFVVVGLGFGYLVGAGLWLLARQSSWRRTLPWLLPALVTAVPLLFPGLGLTLPALYLDAFDVDLEDVDVPAVWRLIGAVRVLAVSLIWLVAPALLGYAKHLHYMVRDRWMGYAVVALVYVLGMLLSAAGLVFAPPAQAGRTAVTDAAAGRTPSFYYGIKPEWMCATPVTDPVKVPVEGGELDPRKAYVLLGDADGRAVLWDAQEKGALKIPLSSLRLVPAEAPRRPCP